MSVQIASATDRDRFNEFIARFDWGDLLQSWEWGDLKARGEWKPIRVYLEKKGQIVAAASLLRRTLPLPGTSILYASRGPVLDTRDPALVREFIEGLKEVARKEGAILLKIDPPIPIEDTESEANLRAVGFQPILTEGFGGTQPKCVMQLDLAGRTLDEIMGSFHEKWRYNIRLAGRKGVTVQENCGREDIPTFYKLLEETTARDGFRVRSLKYFQDMWDCLSPAGYAKVAISYYDGQPLSGVFNFHFGDKAWYTYGASSNAHRNVMPNHLMQWTMIQWAHQKGCKWYDFRGVSPKKGTGDEHLEGLNKFKAGFSPRFVEYIGEYDLVLSPLLYWGWVKMLPRVRAAMKKKNAVATSAPAQEA